MSYPGQITMAIWIYIITKFTMWMKSKPSYVNRPRPWEQTYATRIYTILQDICNLYKCTIFTLQWAMWIDLKGGKTDIKNPAMWIDLGIDTSEC